MNQVKELKESKSKELLNLFLQIQEGTYEYGYSKSITVMIGKANKNCFISYLSNKIHMPKVRVYEKSDDTLIKICNKHDTVCMLGLNQIKNIEIKNYEDKGTAFNYEVTFHYVNGLDYQILF